MSARFADNRILSDWVKACTYWRALIPQAHAWSHSVSLSPDSQKSNQLLKQELHVQQSKPTWLDLCQIRHLITLWHCTQILGHYESCLCAVDSPCGSVDLIYRGNACHWRPLTLTNGSLVPFRSDDLDDWSILKGAYKVMPQAAWPSQPANPS